MTDYATKDLTRTVPSNEILKVKKDRKYIKKERFNEEEKAERKKKQKAYIEKHGEMQPRRKKLYPVTKGGTKEKKSKLKNPKFYGYSNIKKY